MSDKRRVLPLGFFTVEEANLVCIYSKKSRQDAIDGMYCMIPYTPDFDMLSLMCETLKKLQSISNEEFESYDFEEIVE